MELIQSRYKFYRQFITCKTAKHQNDGKNLHFLSIRLMKAEVPKTQLYASSEIVYEIKEIAREIIRELIFLFSWLKFNV